VSLALICFIGRGLVLNVCAHPFSEKGEGVSVEVGATGGGNEGRYTVAIAIATPDVGIAGGRPLSSFSLLLSSHRLALLARSRLLLPEC